MVVGGIAVVVGGAADAVEVAVVEVAAVREARMCIGIGTVVIGIAAVIRGPASSSKG